MQGSISRIKEALATVIEALFRKPGVEPLERLVFIITAVAVYLFGLLQWAAFCNYGKISFRAADWYKEHAFFSAIQQALADATIPYHTNHIFHGTDRFMAVPELVFSPQVLLLALIDDIGTFVLLHILILYTIGFIGCLAVRSTLRLSAFSFTVLALLFGFNGYITSHLAVGHTMWGGYFFLPWFFLVLLKITRSERSTATDALALAFVFFFILLQGSLHIFVACLLYLSLFVVFNPRFLKIALWSIPALLLLNAYRLLPAIITFGDHRLYFQSGYPTLATVIEAFTFIKQPSIEMVRGLTGALYWWELDVFIGLAAFAFLVYFGVYRSCKPTDDGLRFGEFNLPNAAMAVFAISHFFSVIARLPLPLASVERVPSRFLILPIVVLLIISAARLDRALGKFPRLGGVHLLAGLALVQTGFELVTHLRVWTIESVNAALPPIPALDITIVDKAGDVFYVTLLNASFAITGIALVACGALLAWSRWRTAREMPLESEG